MADLSAGAAAGPTLDPAAVSRCRRRVHLDHDPHADRSARRPVDPGLQLRYDRLAAHREQVRAELAATFSTGLADNLPADLATMAQRPAAIWAPRLRTRHRIATPDLLILASDGGYLPVLIRGHRTTDPGSGAALSELSSPLVAAPSASKKLRSHRADVLALAHVYRLLQELGVASGQPRGGIIGYGGPSADASWNDGAVIAWHRLDRVFAEYDGAFADRLAVAGAAASGAPALAHASKVGECRVCPWWTVCGPELEARHDVSLLAAGPDVDLLRTRGLNRIDDVAALDADVAAALPLTSIPAAEARIRARAMVRGIPLVRRREVVDPVRADVELDVDMESFSDDGAYLWGTYATGVQLPGFEQGYRPFVTWDGLDNPGAGRHFVAFWDYLRTLRSTCEAAGLSFAAYCYSHKAEERWLFGTPARFPDEPGMPTRAEVAAFCSSPQWVDLYLEVRRCFVVPGSMRLKRIAHIAGFSWRDPEPGGENSMAWYRTATGHDGASEADIAANRARILRYNEDDVIATFRLRQWMSDAAQEMPTVAELDTR